MPFKCGFDMRDYRDVWPEMPDYIDETIINSQYDSYDDRYWRKQTFPEIIGIDFLQQEAERLKNGVWMLCKDEMVWIPPNYYQYLQYGVAGGAPPQFRLKRLKTIYQKIRVRKDARYIGTYNIKNRQDGDTTMNMSDNLWEIHAGELANGMIGIQSKTRNDSINPCWFNLTTNWNAYPYFFKDLFYPHFISGANIAEKLEFRQPPDRNNPNDLGKNSVITYFPAVFNAMDGKGNVRKCILDEVNKWVECSFADTFVNYLKFMMPGRSRKGIFEIFSSPSDTNGKHNDEAYKFWQEADPATIENSGTGATKNRIMRLYANPLDGIDGFYDKFGDADPQEVYEHIQRERKNARPEKLMGEVRGYPLPIIGTNKPNEEELFGATDSQSIWINKKGITDRRLAIVKEKKKLVQYGNLEWPNNVIDSGVPLFRADDTMEFNNETARFVFTDNRTFEIDPSDLKIAPHPSICESVIGTDPFNLRYGTKNKITGSMGAGVNWKFRDLILKNNLQYPSSAYLARPWHQSIYMEDMILWCVFTRSMINYENKNTDLEKYFEDRGYLSYMLVEDGAKGIETPDGIKVKRGDAPDGRGANAFLNNGISLINGVTNKPLTPEEKYLLELVNIEEILDDLLKFNKDDTQKAHLTMALMQALIGRNKLLFKKIRKKSKINDNLITHLFE